MSTTVLRAVLASVLIAAVWTGMAFGELSVSVTISGPIEEIVPLLQHLKDLGIGAGAAHVPGAGKIEIQSVGIPQTPATPQPPPPPPKPPLALTDAKTDPAAAKPGANVLVTVALSDPDHLVDTIAATIDGVAGTVELYDNGTHGDAKAGDAVWTATTVLAPDMAPGEHAIAIKAFGANGSPVATKDAANVETPLACQTKIVVQS